MRNYIRTARRSREGAWIEIDLAITSAGLLLSRSREGAWIEIRPHPSSFAAVLRRSREGAWIEIDGTEQRCNLQHVAPARERGLKSHYHFNTHTLPIVAPARERGLK